MPNRPLPSIAEDRAEVECRLRQARRPERKRRLHLLVLIQRQEVATRLEEAEHLAVHCCNTVTRWLGRYELARPLRRGRACRIARRASARTSSGATHAP